MGGEQMEEIRIFGPEHFPVLPDREEVFRWLGCGGEEPCRGAFEAQWTEAVDCLKECARPLAAALRCGESTLTVFLTLGPGPEDRMSELFRREEYVRGSLLNTLSDEMLFQMDALSGPLLAEMLRREGLWAGSRMEPGVELTLSEQRRRMPPVQRAVPFAGLSDTGVLYPTKSMMYVVRLSREPCAQGLLHDCARCAQKSCPYRKVSG